MSATDPHIDLDALARERKPLAPPRRARRFLVPGLLVLAFAALFARNLGDFLGGAREVGIVRPVPAAGEPGVAAAGQVVSQAAGWIEPDPAPVHVAALTPGVVRAMLVQESDPVEAGQVLARLIDDDARLALQRAEGELAEAGGEAARVRAELLAARESLANPIELEAARAGAEARLAGSRARTELRRQARVQGQARLALADDELAVQHELEAAGAAGPRQVEIAASRVAEARGALAELEAEVVLAEADERAAETELERAQRSLELRIEDRRRVAAGEGGLAQAEARVRALEAARDEARLRLERTEVRAPCAGVVLERLAVEGSALDGADHAVATLYDPGALRVRVDVPQQDLARIAPGQRASIESDARPGRPYAGRVIRLVRRADIQKVTVQAHVRLLDGDALLCPEMLVQVRFLGEAGEAQAEGVAPRGVSIPYRLVRDGRVWRLDPEHGTAVSQPVVLGAREGERVRVTEGLDLSDKLLEADGAPLREGERVRAREEAR